MKRICIILSAIASLFTIFSCDKQGGYSQQQQSSFEATFEQPIYAGASKTMLAGNGKSVYWENHDEVAVIYTKKEGTKYYLKVVKFVAIDEGDQNTRLAIASGENIPSGYEVAGAFYPYSALIQEGQNLNVTRYDNNGVTIEYEHTKNQVYRENNFGKEANPAFGMVEKYDGGKIRFKFYNLGAVLIIPVKCSRGGTVSVSALSVDAGSTINKLFYMFKPSSYTKPTPSSNSDINKIITIYSNPGIAISDQEVYFYVVVPSSSLGKASGSISKTWRVSIYSEGSDEPIVTKSSDAIDKRSDMFGDTYYGCQRNTIYTTDVIDLGQ